MRVLKDGRARLLGAAVGTCLVTAIGVSSAIAQDATPAANAEATPSTQTDQPPEPTFGGSAAEKTALAEQIQDVTDTIATVQKDRDAVAGSTDVAAVDDLLAKAASLRDAAKTALEGDDISSAPRQLVAAQATAMAAEELLRAQLSDYGLPSQQAGASRTLVAAYNTISEVGDRVSESTDADAQSFVTTAQGLYQTAYDLYNAGTYAQAARTAEVATQVGAIADMLSGDVAFSAGGKVTVNGGPANTEVVIVDPNGDGRSGRVIKDGRPGERSGMEPSTEVIPFTPDQGKGGFVVVEPNGPFSGIAGGEDRGDFSTESPLEVPAPDFD